MDDKQNSIRFHYIKSPQFRVVHADGIIGGPTPKLNLHLAFYSERVAIPQQTVHTVKDGVLGEEVLEQRVGRDGIVREVEVDTIMDIATARVLHTWLGDQLKIIEQLSGSTGTKT
jgi:hypothetical protein